MKRNRMQPWQFPHPGWEISPNPCDGDKPQYDIAFLLAPNIPIPSKSGNAIATLVTALASGMPYKSVIFSTKPPGEGEHIHFPGYDVAYYQKNLTQSIWDRGPIFTRIKSVFITPTRYAWRQYALDAAEACVSLGVKCLVVEDVADFGWVVRRMRAHGIKVILHQHAFTQRNYRSFLWRRIERNLDKIIFVSKTTLDMTEAKYGKLKTPAGVVYNGVNLAHYDPEKWLESASELRKDLSISNNERVITFVGRLTGSKGILQALNAYLSMGRKDVIFLIIGAKDHLTKPDFYHQLNSLLDKAISNNFPLHFYENISQDILPSYYLLSDTILVPSIRFEGLPKVVTEALAMGIPVIASDRGGIWELLEEGRNSWKIADPISPTTIRDAVAQSLSIDEIKLASMKQGIIKDDRPKMDQKKMIDSFQEELNEIIDNITR